jgi:dTDP-4-amino-4,6-dideoxygalactose transaminase
MQVPFFRPAISEAEVNSVAECVRSGWLTTGGKVREFEQRFAAYANGKHAVAVNSCTAALHLALEALGLKRGDMVLVPTFTFAATAEVVRYFDAVPVFVDSEPTTLCMSSHALAETLEALSRGVSVAGLNPPYGRVRAVIPVHYAGQMVDVDAILALARKYELKVIEDAAHTLPAFYRASTEDEWRAAGTVSDVACFSFYANKCITTGEGGMALTSDEGLASRMRVMSLHGMSKDAWNRFGNEGRWYYEIIAPGFKYNLTDIAGALGVVQLGRADEFWRARREQAGRYIEALAGAKAFELPRELPDRRHSWHVFALRLMPGALRIDRARVIEEMRKRGITCSVHWMPLHQQPYYRERYGYVAEQFPIAHREWQRLISLPIFPGMTDAEQEHVIESLLEISRDFAA